MSYRVICGDVTNWQNDGEPFHAAFGDCPYHLGEKGFMGRDWDAFDYGVSFSPATWRNIATWLHPGAFLFIAAGSINDDLISVAMREADLVKHHKAVVYWQTGQGFPKSTKIADSDIHEGFRYGSQCIKNTAETILIFRREYEGRPVDSITSSGAGALNIDAGRIATNDKLQLLINETGERDLMGAMKGKDITGRKIEKVDSGLGRWPASTLFCHSSLCRRLDGVRSVKPGNGSGRCSGNTDGSRSMFGAKSREQSFVDEDGNEQIPRYACAQHCQECGASWAAEELETCPHCGGATVWDCVCRVLDGQSGYSKCRHDGGSGHYYKRDTVNCYGNYGANEVIGHGDEGGASRFYHQSDYALEAIEAAAQEIAHCAICQKHGIMNRIQQEVIPCQSVNSAEKNLSQKGKGRDSVAALALKNLHQDSLGISESSRSLVNTAASNLSNTQETIENTVTQNAPDLLEEKVARCVRFAESLCDKCETHIVQSIVLMLQGHCPEYHLTQDCIHGRDAQMLRQNLAKCVESLGNLDTTAIIQNQKMLLGFVTDVIKGYIESARSEQSQSIYHRCTELAIENAPPFVYSAKAGKAEKNAGLDGMPIKQTVGGGGGIGNYLEDVDSASGKFGSEKAPARNPHPTVKPLALCVYLAKLLLPPPEYAPRRIVVPFSGSGSEMIGAMLAGWEEVVGIEQSEEYCEIARARLAWWAEWMDRTGHTDPAKILKAARTVEAKMTGGQALLF